MRPLGGKEAAIDLVRSSDNPELRRLGTAWDSLQPRDKERTRLERLCQDCDVPSGEFLAEVIAIWWRRYAASPTASRVNGPESDADVSFPMSPSLETGNLLDPQFGADE